MSRFPYIKVVSGRGLLALLFPISFLYLVKLSGQEYKKHDHLIDCD